jgi:hypothetical protein
MPIPLADVAPESEPLNWIWVAGAVAAVAIVAVVALVVALNRRSRR